MDNYLSKECGERIYCHFEALYGRELAPICLERFAMLLGRYGVGSESETLQTAWDEKSIWLITYGDTIQSDSNSPLQTLDRFLSKYLSDLISTVHILPFFPYSSDDGFSVINYRQVDESVGEWQDIEQISKRFKLVFDLVLNHVSRESNWFRDYVLGIAPATGYFIEQSNDTDLSAVIRPRSTPLLSPVMTRSGQRHLWTTFSSDQIDLNFASPDVLFEFLDLILFYISKGASAIRLDAIAYLWKKIGTNCINLPETHIVIKLLRHLVNLVAPNVILLSETNLPHTENISYFGQGDEAHLVYQFSLPPLLLHAILTERTSTLTSWAKSLDNTPTGCTFLNFTASHDGIGVRPLEGLVPQSEIALLVDHVVTSGGRYSTKRNSDGTDSVYELNITYFDALKDPAQPENTAIQIDRFICSQAVALALKGIPAIYINSLFGTPNDLERFEQTGQARALNRKKWQLSELVDLLSTDTHFAQVYQRFCQLLKARRNHPAFDPAAPQQILEYGESIFAVSRTDIPSKENILCLHNFSSTIQEITITEACVDLITDASYGPNIKLSPFQVLWLKDATR